MIYNINTEAGSGMVSLLKEITEGEPYVFPMNMMDETDVENVLQIVDTMNTLFIFNEMNRATDMVKKLINDSLSDMDTSNKTIIINNVSN